MSPRPPPKISLKHDWMKELGSEVARQPEGEVAGQAKGSQPTQPNPNPNHYGTGRPVVCSQSVGSSSTLQAENSRVPIKKIENHLHRQDLQLDLQQNNAYNPLSEKSKQMIQDVGNVEPFELFETDL